MRPWPGVTSCPYVPVVFLAPFLRPLMQVLAHYLPDRSLREVRETACKHVCMDCQREPCPAGALLSYCALREWCACL